MRGLWRKTFELFRWRPILWLPYIVAQLTATFLWWLRGIAAKVMFEWFTTSRSASVFGVKNFEQAVMANNFAYLPLGFAAEIACVSLFVFALVVTSKLVAVIYARQEPDLIAALRPSAFRWREILWFSLKTLIVCLVSFAVVTSAALYVMEKAHRPQLSTSWSVSFASVVIVAVHAVAGWLLMPATIRLLRSSPSQITHPEVRRQGVLFTIFAGVCAVALGLAIIPRMTARIVFDSRAELAAVSIMNDLFADSVYVPLFIGLSILSSEHSNETEAQQTFS